MRRVERSAVVAAPPHDVFGFLSDLDNLPAWQTGILSVRRTSEGPVGLGATAVVVRELMGQRIEAPLKVTAYEPPRRLTVQSTVGGVAATAALDLKPQGHETAVTFAMEISASGFTAFMEPMLAATAATDLGASLGRLQQRFAGEPDR